ncbi:MAG: hypothetical protein BEN19_02845 [Epulopiscium sp. Nuni2H_MBin003]|nr:MAG: hypothetical protein BEN19_02845 [Epulopiscium sp. Nuni2H_MBin003]
MKSFFNTFSNRVKGIIFILIASLGFALMSTCVKLSGDLPSLQKAFFRNLVGPFVAGYLVYKHNASFIGKRSSWNLLWWRSFAGTVGVVFNFYAIDHLILSDASMINKLSPIFTIIFSYIFLKEKLKYQQAIAILVAFSGMLLIVKPGFNIDVLPGIIGVLGAICAGVAYTCLRVLGKNEPYYTTVFVFSTLSSVMLLPFLIYMYIPMSLIQFILLILSGIFATVAQFSLTIAYSYAPANEISIFDYSNVIFTAIISLVVFGVFPDIFSILGYIIIFSATFFMFSFNKRQAK